MATPATLDYSSLSFPVEVRLVPASHTHQRTGIPMDPDWSTWHDTGNPDARADADSHDDWIMAGCPDEDGNPTDTGWHFTVDDGKAIQHIPLNEVAWHAGDKATGPGNRTSIAIEECVNSDRNAAKTRANAAELHAFLIRKLGLKGGTIAALVQHNKWSGKDCPHVIRSQGLWPNVQAQVAARLAAPGPVDPPPPPPPTEPDIIPGVDFAIAKRAFDNPSNPALKNYVLTKGGKLSELYIARVKQTGQLPKLIDRWAYDDGRVYYPFSNGDMALFNDKDKSIRWIDEEVA